MKRLISCLLIFILLFAIAGCGSKPAQRVPSSSDPYENLKIMLENGEKLFGIAYLGPIEGDTQQMQVELSKKEYLRDIPYVANIDKVVEAGGNYVYCIIPVDESVTVSIHKLDRSEIGIPSLGEQMASFNEPVLVRGNADNFIPEMYVVAQREMQRVTYPLGRSGLEGRLENLDNLMFDFTPYNLLPEFHNVATEEKPLCASWLGDIRDAFDTEFALLLYIHESGDVRFSYGNDAKEVSEFYTGTWEIEGNLLKLRMEGGEPSYGAEVLQKNIDFEWTLENGMMYLHHVGGDLLLPGTDGNTFEFWSND